MDLKLKEIGKLRPKGRPTGILGLTRQSVRIWLRLWSLQVRRVQFNTLRTLERAADSERDRAFHQATFLCLWVCVFAGLGVCVACSWRPGFLGSLVSRISMLVHVDTINPGHQRSQKPATPQPHTPANPQTRKHGLAESALAL